MSNRLSNMLIKQVHLVGSPAVKREYLIVKSEEKMTDAEKVAKAAADAEEVAKAKSAAADAEDAKDGGSDDDQEDANGKKKMKKSQNEIDLEKAVSTKDATILKTALDLLKSSDGDVAKSIVSALEASLSGTKVEDAKVTKLEIAEIFKSQMPELVKTITEPLSKALEATNKELGDVKKSNALLIGERTEREIAEVAKSLVGDVEKNTEHVRLMKSQLSPDAFEAFVKREQENADMIRKSPIFKEIGSTGRDGGNTDDPYKQLTEIANSMIQKSEGGKLAFTDAFGRACAERPDLYDDYRTGSYANNSNRED